MGFVVLPGEFVAGRGRGAGGLCCGLGVEFFVDSFDVGEHALEGLENLFGLIIPILVETEFKDVGSGPEHAEGGVAATVGGVHRAYGVVGLLYAALLS